MSRCLKGQTLLLLYEGEGTRDQQTHLKECEDCSKRYEKLGRDLTAISRVLREQPPPQAVVHHFRPFVVRWLPGAALAMTLVLVWVGVRLWRNPAVPPVTQESTNGSIWSLLEGLTSNPILQSDAIAMELATEGAGSYELAATALEADRPCEWYDLPARSEAESAIEELEISAGTPFPSCMEINPDRERREAKEVRQISKHK